MIINKIHSSNHFRDCIEDSRTLTDELPLAIMWKDLNSNYIGANRKALEMGKFKKESQLIDQSDDNLPWADYAPHFCK